nr:reverse transcriptase domain-containing protein [Tanacetum cinerariifolium]
TGGKERSVSTHLESRYQESRSQRTKALSESKDSRGGHWKSKSRKQKSSIEEEDLSQPWTCEEADPFTPRICYFELPKKSRMPNKVKTYDRRASECVRIFEFMHGITNPELIKRMHDNIPKSVDEMMRITTTFLRGEVATSNQAQKSTSGMEASGYKGKFKAPPQMTTPIEKRNNNKFCEFHREVGHNTDECMHLKRQIEELIKNGKLSYVIKELKQVPSTAYKMLKFPVLGGILTLQSSRIISLESTMVSLPEARPSDIIQAAEKRIKVAIHLEYPEQTIAIGLTLTEEGRKAYVTYLDTTLMYLLGNRQIWQVFRDT